MRRLRAPTTGITLGSSPIVPLKLFRVKSSILLDTPLRRCDIRRMPIQLERFADYTKLPAVTYSLAWICCECLTVNAPRHVDCDGCGKQRWLSLGISIKAAEKLAKEIK